MYKTHGRSVVGQLKCVCWPSREGQMVAKQQDNPLPSTDWELCCAIAPSGHRAAALSVSALLFSSTTTPVDLGQEGQVAATRTGRPRDSDASPQHPDPQAPGRPAALPAACPAALRYRSVDRSRPCQPGPGPSGSRAGTRGAHHHHHHRHHQRRRPRQQRWQATRQPTRGPRDG